MDVWLYNLMGAKKINLSKNILLSWGLNIIELRVSCPLPGVLNLDINSLQRLVTGATDTVVSKTAAQIALHCNLRDLHIFAQGQICS